MNRKPPELRKAEVTRVAIVTYAMHIARRDGLDALNLSALAAEMWLSLSCLYTRMGSMIKLKLAVLKSYHLQFETQVHLPAQKANAGLPRLFKLFDLSVQYVAFAEQGRCIYLDAALQGGRHGDAVTTELGLVCEKWQQAFEDCVRQAISNGEMTPGTDPVQLAFEIFGQLLSLQYEQRTANQGIKIQRAKTAFARIVKNYCSEKCTSFKAECLTQNTTGASQAGLFRWPEWLFDDAMQ